MGEMEEHPAARLRISDEDRHKVAEVLREAAGEGRLDMDELDQRLDATYAAKVYADLIPITADLPSTATPMPAASLPQPAASTGGVALPAPTSSVSCMGDVSRRGRWQVDKTHTAFTLMGGATIDLREAHFASKEVVINANAIMGGVDVIVNASTNVTVDGVGILGSFEQARDRVEPTLGPDSPHVQVKGIALMGAVTVVRKPMPGEKRRRRKMLGH